ncbi:MAG TPA: hypothetical protein VN493_23510 [Thermoanaerobaculia bacterium]|nr:hypothetical protein [Thermoanaerobaculia bacterium]
MDQDRSTSREQGGMQFEQADFGSEGEQKFACSFCKTPLGSSYFHLNDQPACEACRYKVEAEMAIPPGVSGFFKAAMAGAGAAAVGAGIYYAVLALSGYEVGIIAILVGFLVGRAVRWGSKGRGGWAYQTLAVVLTYLAIVGTYIPLIVEEMMKDEPAAMEQAATVTTATASSKTAQAEGAPAQGGEEAAEMGVGGVFLGLGALILLAAALPFLAGIENIMGIVIIAIGLYEAWRINKRMILTVDGPFEVGKLAPPQPEPAA